MKKKQTPKAKKTAESGKSKKVPKKSNKKKEIIPVPVVKVEEPKEEILVQSQVIEVDIIPVVVEQKTQIVEQEVPVSETKVEEKKGFINFLKKLFKK